VIGSILKTVSVFIRTFSKIGEMSLLKTARRPVMNIPPLFTEQILLRLEIV
jgi:hypothetical protein